MANQELPLSTIQYQDTELLFENSNEMVAWRTQSFYSKEPDTIFWISHFQPNEVFVDIGANIGLYSILAAKALKARVFAFEPEAQNYALLNRNIQYNQVQDHCTAYCLALTDTNRVDRLYLSESSLGGSCHTFGDDLDYHLKPRKSQFSQGSISFSLDQLIEQGAIPQPHHIKIDVDGLEHLVLKGGSNAITDDQLKSLLVELNTHLPEHRRVIGTMEKHGFSYDQRQVDIAIRQKGPFKGIGNYIFFKPEARLDFSLLKLEEEKPATVADLPTGPAITTEADQNLFSFSKQYSRHSLINHVKRCYKNMDIKVLNYPYFYAEEVFPAAYYEQMMKMKPSNNEVISIAESGRITGDTYKERFVMNLNSGLHYLQSNEKHQFWEEFRSWFCSEELMITLVQRFRNILVSLGMSNLNIKTEAMFMRDKKGYGIGPHTDHPQRLITMMLYLPEDDQHQHLGTSIYEPHEKSLICSGAAIHHSPNKFERVHTVKYKPNSVFGFLKTNNSFHGFEKMQDSYERDSMVYIVKHKTG